MSRRSLAPLCVAVVAALSAGGCRPTEGSPDPAAAAALVVDHFSTAAASAFVDAVAGDGDDRWVPWLVDLLRLNPSTRVSGSIGETLESITGIDSEDRVSNLINFGSWAATRSIDGGDGYRDFKVALYGRFDPRFGPLLASVADPVELAAIQWGGVPVGGIPELNEPERAPATEADWMVDDEVVFGVEIAGEAVAYPLRILARHELANDVVGGRPLVVVYCSLCRSALVFDRLVEGRAARFLTSGLLSNSNKIMVDVETETLWSHLRGVGIGGQHLGTELALLPVRLMRWSDWIAEYPDTSVLALPKPVFFDDPERPPIAYDYTPGKAYASYDESPDVWFPVIETPAAWPLKTDVIGIAIGDDALAISVAELNDGDRAMRVEVGGETFTIEPTGVGGRVIDAAGDPVVVERLTWFAWYANHRNTRTVTSE